MFDSATKKTLVIFSLVIMIGLGLSTGAAYWLYDYAKKQKTLAIERDVESKAEYLQLRINSALKDLSATAAFFYANESVSRKQFEEFVSISLEENSATISLAWVPRVFDDERDSFEKKLSGSGVRNQKIVEYNSHGLETVAFRQKVYYPVKNFVSNVDGLLFPGLNMAGQYEIRQRIRNANKRSEVLVMQSLKTNRFPIDLISFQALLPLYDESSSNAQDVIGFILGQFDIKKLLIESFGEPENISMILFDVDARAEEQLLYINLFDKDKQQDIKSMADLANLESLYWTRYFDVGDRKWLAAFVETSAENNARLNMLPYIGLLFGFLITAIFSVYLLIAQMRRHKVEILQQESHAKSRFFQALGHDLRQPLNSMRLYLSQYEKEEKPADNKLNTVFEKVRKNIDGLNDMFTSLLDITRLEAGAIKPELRAIPLQVLITELGDEYDIVTANKGLELNVECIDVNVYSDQMLLENVLRNLLSNAIKYTEKGEVSLIVESKNKEVRIIITDTGVGIAKQDINKILQAYHRGNNTKQLEGLGLGLAIVKQTCELLEHSLSIESELNKGTRVELNLKKAEGENNGKENESDMQGDISNANILLIDDDVTVLDDIKTLLISWGTHVATVSDIQALENKEIDIFNIIICDYHLGETNGIELVNSLIEKESDKKVLIISADPSQALQTHCEQANFYFLPKPISLLKLKSLLHHFLHS